MKRAKKRKFREPPFWVRFFHPIRYYEIQAGEPLVKSILLTGEIGRIDNGIRIVTVP